MTTYAAYNPTSLLVSGDVKARDVILASGTNGKRGTVLGRNSTTDKYVPCVKTANDGSQVPAAVLAADTDASAADVATVAYDYGEFVGELLTIDASWTLDTLEAALRAAGSTMYVRKAGVYG